MKHFTTKTENKDRLKKDIEKVNHISTKTGNKDRLKKDIEKVNPFTTDLNHMFNAYLYKTSFLINDMMH